MTVRTHVVDLPRRRRRLVAVILVAAAGIRSITALVTWLDFGPLTTFGTEGSTGSRDHLPGASPGHVLSPCDDFGLWEAEFATTEGMA